MTTLPPSRPVDAVCRCVLPGQREKRVPIHAAKIGLNAIDELERRANLRLPRAMPLETYYCDRCGKIVVVTFHDFGLAS